MDRQVPDGGGNEAFALCDVHGIVLDLNQRFAASLGTARETCLGQPLELRLPVDVRERFLGELRACARSEGPAQSVVSDWISLEGHWYELTIERIPEGQSWMMLCSLRMVERPHGQRALSKSQPSNPVVCGTAPRPPAESYPVDALAKALAKMRDSADRAQGYLERAGMIVIGLDSGGCVQHLNQKAAQLLGLPVEQVIGRSWFEGWSPARQRDELLDCFEKVMSGGDPSPSTFESAVLTSNGGERLVEWHCAVARSKADDASVWLSGVDVTERRRTERLMREQERFAELGKMSAVIAHEIKNPLTAIAGGLELLLQEVSSAPSRVLGQKILSQVAGMRGVMNDLLGFAKPHRGELVQFCMHKLLEGSLDLIKHAPNHRHLQLKLKGKPVPLVGDPQQLSQVFANLLLNAAQAIPGDGSITVELSRRGSDCCVTISDSGEGISPAVSDRIFDAFFTTKLHGTGLGLAICRRFVQWHGGRLEFSPREAGGTRVDVFIPTRIQSASSMDQFIDA